MSLSLAGIFAAGLLTFVTPCVLPLVPIYLSALLGGDIRELDNAGRGQLLVRAALFSVGFVAVFTLLGLTASSVGAVLSDHKAVVEGAGALLILIFGLKFLGFIRLPWMDQIVRGDDSRLQTRFAWLNAILMGILFAAGWSPCVGPVLGSVLSYTATQSSDPLVGALYLSTYGVGFAIPLLITAAFAQAGTKLLRRIHPYLPKIERAIGVLLVVVAASLLWDLAQTAQPVSGPASAQTVASATQPNDGTPMMMEFYSENCPICRGMKPIVASVTEDCDGHGVRMAMYDISKPELRHLASDYRLVGVPTFVFLNHSGTEVARLIGHQSKQALKQAVSAARGEACPGVGPLPGTAPQVADHGNGSSGGHTACDVDAEALANGDESAAGGSCEGGAL